VVPPSARIADVVLFDTDRIEDVDDGSTNNTPASAVLLIVEVVSPSTQTADRFEKPSEHARNGIPCYWRIELEPDIAVFVHELADGKYSEGRPHLRNSVIGDRNLPWLKVAVNDLLGDYA
jgi:Uma2 family endonuclease